MTQRQAGEWCKARGYEHAYLMDSGRSSQICENGVSLYWPYQEQNEKVPQCIGLKRKGVVNVTTYSGIVNAPLGLNVRREDGTKIGLLRYGARVTGDYLINVSPNAPWMGQNFMHLTAPIVGLAAAQYINYSADVVTPPPTPTVTKTHTIEVYSDGSIRIDGELNA
jgi:hypothetical protein